MALLLCRECRTEERAQAGNGHGDSRLLVQDLGRALQTNQGFPHHTARVWGSVSTSRFRSLPKTQDTAQFCHSQLMLTGMQRETWQRWSFSQPHQGKRINRYQTLSKGSCAKTIKYSCTSHPSWQDHSTEKGINTAPKQPRASHFSPSATASTPLPSGKPSRHVWMAKGTGGQGFLFPLPHLQSFALLQISRV